MNKLVFLAIGVVLLTGLNLSAQKWSSGTLEGEGEVIKQEIALPAFDGVDLGFSGDVILTPGPVQKIVIEGQQNIIDNIKRDVTDGRWKIYYDKHVKDAKNVTVYITVPMLKHVALSGSGSIRSNGKFTGLNDLELAVSGSGDIKFEADAREVEVLISGSGDIEVLGTGSALEASISGSGDVLASSLIVKSCTIHISGSGDAEVHVNGDLEVHISGSGDVGYRGDASVTARISGSGEVSKL